MREMQGSSWLVTLPLIILLWFATTFRFTSGEMFKDIAGGGEDIDSLNIACNQLRTDPSSILMLGTNLGSVLILTTNGLLFQVPLSNLVLDPIDKAKLTITEAPVNLESPLTRGWFGGKGRNGNNKQFFFTLRLVENRTKNSPENAFWYMVRMVPMTKQKLALSLVDVTQATRDPTKPNIRVHQVYLYPKSFTSNIKAVFSAVDGAQALAIEGKRMFAITLVEGIMETKSDKENRTLDSSSTSQWVTGFEDRYNNRMLVLQSDGQVLVRSARLMNSSFVSTKNNNNTNMYKDEKRMPLSHFITCAASLKVSSSMTTNTEENGSWLRFEPSTVIIVVVAVVSFICLVSIAYQWNQTRVAQAALKKAHERADYYDQVYQQERQQRLMQEQKHQQQLQKQAKGGGGARSKVIGSRLGFSAIRSSSPITSTGGSGRLGSRLAGNRSSLIQSLLSGGARLGSTKEMNIKDIDKDKSGNNIPRKNSKTPQSLVMGKKRPSSTTTTSPVASSRPSSLNGPRSSAKTATLVLGSNTHRPSNSSGGGVVKSTNSILLMRRSSDGHVGTAGSGMVKSKAKEQEDLS